MSQGQGNKTVEGKNVPSPTPSELMERLRPYDTDSEPGSSDMDTSPEPGSTTANVLRATAARRSRPPQLEPARAEGQPPASPAPWVARPEGQTPAQAPGDGKETRVTPPAETSRAPRPAPQDDKCSICLEPLSRKKTVVGPCGHKNHSLHLVCALDWQKVLQLKKATKIHCPLCRGQGPFYGVDRQPDEKGAGILATMDADLSEAVCMPIPLDAKDTATIEPYEFDLAEYQKVLRAYNTKAACADARKLHAIKTAKAARKAYNAQMSAVTRYTKDIRRQAYLNMAYRLYDDEQVFAPVPETRPSRATNNNSSSSSSEEEGSTMDEFDAAFA